MQALGHALREGKSLLPRLLPALTATQSRVLATTAAHPAAQQAEAASSSGDALLRDFQIYRWDPETGGKPRYENYSVDINRFISDDVLLFPAPL